MNLLNYSEKLVEAFYLSGIKDAFLVTGGAISPFTTALVDHGGIKMHYLLHEQSAAIAAEAYGYTDGLPALLVVTSGPGVSNALTGVAAAYTNSSPVIVVSGQARSLDVELANKSHNRQIGNQHLDTLALASSVVKLILEPRHLIEVSALVSDLYRKATEGRPGPVWLSLPQDIQRSKSTSFLPYEGSPVDNRVPQDHGADILNIYTRLRSSKAPLILVGAGARAGMPALLTFASKFRIPIATTWPGLDLIANTHPCFVGRPGSVPSSWAANLIVENCVDLLIVGARLDLAQVGYNPDIFAPKAKKIRVDIDPSEFFRLPASENLENFEFNSAAFSHFQGDLDSIDDYHLDEWWAKISSWKLLPKAGEVDQVFSDGMSTYKAIQSISNYSAGKPVVTGSSGTCIEMLLQSWPANEGQRVINSCGLGSMGFGLAAALGVAAKFSEQDIVCIESDGSLAMNYQDLVTIAGDQIPVTIFVLDSEGYKSISLSQSRLTQTPHGTNKHSGLTLPAIKIAESILGERVFTVKSELELEKVLLESENIKAPKIIFLKVSEREEAFPRLISKPDSMGIMTTPPMSELSPAIK